MGVFGHFRWLPKSFAARIDLILAIACLCVNFDVINTGNWLRLKTSAGCLGVLGEESGRRTLKQLISGQLPIENADKRDF